MLLVRHFLKLYELSYVRFFEKKGRGESYVVSLSYFVYRSYLKYQGASQPYGPGRHMISKIYYLYIKYILNIKIFIFHLHRYHLIHQIYRPLENRQLVNLLHDKNHHIYQHIENIFYLLLNHHFYLMARQI